MDGRRSTHGKDGSKILIGNLKEKDHLGDLGVEWRIILKCIINN